MNVGGATLIHRQERLADVLNGLIEEEGVEGVELIRRNGECLYEFFSPELDVETYSRLSAAFAEATENILPGLRTAKNDRLVSDAGSLKVVMVRANDDLLLGALARADLAPDDIAELLREAVHDVNRLVPAP